MKRYKYQLLTVAVISALGLTACGSDDDEEVITPPPAPPVVIAPSTPAPLAFVVTGSVVDASTGDLITNAGAVTLTFKEGDAVSTNVINLEGAAISSISTTDGTFAFRLKEGAALENFSVVISAAGYLSTSQLLDLSNTTESVSRTFELVAVDAAGTVAASETAEVSAGTVAEPVVVEATQTNTNTSAAVAIPAGTVLQNAAGQPVSGTSVSLNVVTAAKSAAENETKLADILPAGLNQANDSHARVALAGASVQMVDNQGNKIKKFSTPIDLSLSIPAGSQVAAGDVVSISSYDEDTGVWTRDEFSATVGALNAATNSHTVNFQTDHLTFFGVTGREPICGSDITYTITGAAVPAGGLAMNIDSSDALAIGNIAAGATSGRLFNAATVARFGIYNGATARVKVYARGNSSQVWYDSQTEVPVCGNIAINLANPTTIVSENFNVNLVCRNDATVTKALTGALVTYGLPKKAKVKATDNNNGSYSLTDLEQGSSYEVKVEPVGVANASTTSFTITADGTNESGNINLNCQTGTGAG
jgi:hypothetical protein